MLVGGRGPGSAVDTKLGHGVGRGPGVVEVVAYRFGRVVSRLVVALALALVVDGTCRVVYPGGVGRGGRH